MSTSTATAVFQALLHPSELLSLFQFKLTQSLGQPATLSLTDRSTISSNDTYKLSYCFLNKTSRSFSRVIQELHKELIHPVCIFYLVLRGLDTIEDDMTIDVNLKMKMLVEFYKYLDIDGWNFTGNSDQEKDKELLVDFHVVIAEYKKLKPIYQKVIQDITERMGKGMAEFRDESRIVSTTEDYNLYCHYVAGLVGIGLTALFINSNLESHPKLILSPNLNGTQSIPSYINENEYLANRMGLFLQKTNIIKDFYTDLKQGRVFWPKEIWEQYVPEGSGIEALLHDEKRALACLNHLCADALELVPDCLEYMSLLTEESVFKFCAIPQIMAMASLTLFFNNPMLFSTDPLKIRKSQTTLFIMQSCKSMAKLKRQYQEFVYTLHSKNHEQVGKNEFDKSFIKIAVVVGGIQRWLNIHSMRTSFKDTQEEKIQEAVGLTKDMRRSWMDIVLLMAMVLGWWYMWHS